MKHALNKIETIILQSHKIQITCAAFSKIELLKDAQKFHLPDCKTSSRIYIFADF